MSFAELSLEYDAAVAEETQRRQHMLLVRQAPTLAIVSILNGAILVALLVGPAPFGPAPVVLWYLVILALSVSQWRGWLRARAAPTLTRVSPRARRRAMRRIGVGAVVWTSALVLLYPADHAPLQLVLCFVIGGTAAGVASLLNPLPQLTRVFVTIALAGVVVRAGLEGTAIHLSLAFMTSLLWVALVAGGQRSYAQLQEMVRAAAEARAAKRDLVDAIESSTDGFALFGPDRRLARANARFHAWFPGVEELAEDAEETMRPVAGDRWVTTTVRPTSRGGWVSVHADVTVLKRREDELVTAKQEAEEADRTKSQFLANMSHELRTPLNAIIGFSQLIEQEIYGPLRDGRYIDHARDISGAGKHLLSIINDILDLSKIEARTLHIAPEIIDVAEVVEWVAAVAGARAGEGTRPIELDLDAETLWADPRAFKQVLLNLLGNAVKFTPPGRGVGLQARRGEGDATVFVVWDEGPGIPADKIAHVTKPFYQCEGYLRKTHEGSGLGLAICQSLMDLHGGRLTIASVEGEGTRVEIAFPPPPQSATAAAA